MHLEAKRLGLTGGILWGLMMFIMTLLTASTGYGSDFLGVMASLYPGYNLTVSGSVVGLVYGFIDGFACLWLFASVYNWLGGKK